MKANFRSQIFLMHGCTTFLTFQSFQRPHATLGHSFLCHHLTVVLLLAESQQGLFVVCKNKTNQMLDMRIARIGSIMHSSSAGKHRIAFFTIKIFYNGMKSEKKVKLGVQMLFKVRIIR